MTDKQIERFFDEVVPSYLEGMRESGQQVADMKKLVGELTKSDKEKTAVFVRQIEKLSKRLDHAYTENAKLLAMLEHANERYDRVYNLLEHHITGNIINNSNN